VNDHTIPQRVSLKQHAWHAMMRWIRPCMAASGALLALQMSALYVTMTSGGIPILILNAADYANPTGIGLADGIFTAILRIDMMDILVAVRFSIHQLLTALLVSGILLIIITPLLMGVLEQYCAVLRERARPFSAIFGWYLDLRLTAKAVGLGLVLALIKWGTRIVGALPGLVLLVWATSTSSPEATDISGFMFLAFLLIWIGEAAAYWVYTLVLPAQYLLASDRSASFAHVLSAGVKVFRGRRWDYFLFRLSFILWYIIVDISYGTMAFLVQPYSELANLLYFQAAVKPARAEDAPAQM
jgi:hypothetical protein